MEQLTRGMVTCPVCGATTVVGLPRSTTDPVISASPSPELDDAYTGENAGRRKRRQSCCPNGHGFYMYFEF
ncbi:DUF1178 family protein [Natronomonas marina]|jgi:hypothetical protein|uniref:DUF1178 family protein n=1 Tax=Natronomonas marina TaxID=2961939 RepID=UPI0020C9ECC7|nr:DUF1178 family protein [Natronomonas marina]